jgi:hypothetical protein
VLPGLARRLATDSDRAARHSRVMRSAFLAVLCLLVFASAASASSVDVPMLGGSPSWLSSVYERPALAADGTLAFAVAQTPDRLTIMRLVPGAQAPEKLFDVPRPTAGFEFVQLGAAGRGFFVSQETTTLVCAAQTGGLNHGPCPTQSSAQRITLFADPRGPGVDVPVCSGGDCSCMSGWALSVAADADHMVISRQCQPPDGRTIVVRDLATGTDTAVDLPLMRTELLAGDYIEGQSDSFHESLFDWRTGQDVHDWQRYGPVALLPDGTVFRTPSDGDVVRQAVSDAQPIQLRVGVVPVSGQVQAAADSKVVVEEFTPQQPRLMRIRSADGTLLGEAAAGADATATFDGTHVAWVDRSCIMTRVHIWAIGETTPPPLLAGCARPRVDAAQAAVPRARVHLVCPASAAQGCGLQLMLGVPYRPTPRVFHLLPGTATWVTVASGLGPASCRKLMRTHVWSVLVMSGIDPNYHTVRVTPRNRCRVATAPA